MNWQDQLKAFREANPDLPEGEDPIEESDLSTDNDDIVLRQPRLDVRIERKGRAGKTATLIDGWTLDSERLLVIASGLKQKLGVGGSVAEGRIMIQGDRREQVVAQLKEMGFKARSI